MLYLREFTFTSWDAEEQFINDEIQRTCYNSFYPFGVLGKKMPHAPKENGKIDYQHALPLTFEPITVFYGGNGSGKTTALNIIAEKTGAERDALYNRTVFFENYLEFCRFELAKKPRHKRIITSDDVFNFMLNLRSLNEGIDDKRSELYEDYLDAKHARFRMESLDDYDRLKKTTTARRRTQSQYVRQNLMGNVREHSNGESAFLYFTQRMPENGLYLLDEPENSLSPSRQRELAEYLENSVRFFGCQIIMSTHSPFLLSLKDAKIYDLDQTPLRSGKWTDLAEVRTYFDFFMERKDDFLKSRS